ncbi:aKG-HExxH-type peptide beta-hydroxylase [Acinetobacter oleivorans]|uniref:aKG-HExxH-type peptide beta-hydroxylase n=1 Tax=Acinetobacter oleivorans TaxID=1148157 RepID=UPI003F1C27B8
MILQTNISDQMQNIILMLARRYSHETRKITSLDSLKSMYRRYLKDAQGRETSDPYNLVISDDYEKASVMAQGFNGEVESTLDDMGQSTIIKIERYDNSSVQRVKIENALEELGLYSNEHFSLLELIITDIFILPSNGSRGGSSSDGIGLIWANPKETYPLIDVVEFLVHELTHHCMFIDEQRYGHYDYDTILNENNWAESAILKRPRPIDKVLHSIVVSLEIILFRDMVIGHPVKPKVHPPTDILVEQVKKSIASLWHTIRINEEKDKIVLHERAKNILLNVENVIQAY